MRNFFSRSEPIEPPPPPIVTGKALDVLVVESDQKFLKKLTDMMRSARLPDNDTYLNIIPASNLRDAIDKIENHRYDIILTDVNLSDASCFLVLEELIEFGNKTPIIVLSNITNWSMIMQSAQAGISDFLLKKTLDSDVMMRSVFYAIERDRLELKVTRAEGTYRSLVDILPVGLFRSNAEGKLSYANNVFANLLNRTPESLEGQLFNNILPGGVARTSLQGIDKVSTENATVELEIPLGTESNPQLTVLCVATPLYDQYGKVEGVQSVVLDVTNQKQIQADKEASHTLGALQSGLSIMANELNNAMAPILLDAENLRDSDTSEIPKETIERIESSVQKARSVLRPFLVSTQRVGPRSEPLDPYKIILHSLAEVKQELPTRIQLETSIPERLKTIEGDASLLHKMLVNVMDNAVDSMPDRGLIHVSASLDVLDTTSEQCQSLDLRPGEYLHVVVKDQGEGIPPHLMQRVFEPFYTTKQKPHTGVGLTETLGIVKSHKSNLRLVSHTSTGTQFHVYLPIDSKKVETVGKINGVKTSNLHQGKKLILLADDEENIVKSATMLLRHNGYKVISAANGAEALSKFSERQSEIGLVITDYAMPLMDGPDLIKAIRKISPTVSIVLCTGLEIQDSMDEMNGLDVNGTMFKPFTAAALAETISKLNA
ncbi:MAG: response regulator [Verrucomicrobia bacterium]|jgi:two-component system, cell cycle sensor histidine kinase and response regulator CckA|nr:response regulator [Verrucomicrobiota bacterium]